MKVLVRLPGLGFLKGGAEDLLVEVLLSLDQVEVEFTSGQLLAK